MINAELLEQAGISYEAGLNRFMNDVELFEVVLTAFVDADVLERAEAAYAAKDYAKLMQVVHEAKGASGNAGLDKLYAEASTLVKLLRSPSFTEDEVTEDYGRFISEYIALNKGINAALVR